MADVEGIFCIDRWEASLVEITEHGERPFSPYKTPEGLRVRAVSQEGVVPQGYVSRDQAERACKESGKRLCAEDEWTVACMGAPAHAFPYGDERSKGACNDSGISPLHVFYAEAPETYQAGPMNDPRLNQQPKTVAKAGEFARCTNGYGVFDMVGNLHEWVDEGPDANGHGRFRGGWYGDAENNGPGCFYVTSAHEPKYHDYSTGFRCCADAVVSGG
jgi:formylglycine-generating enzyme required for sulfatase activity